MERRRISQTIPLDERLDEQARVCENKPGKRCPDLSANCSYTAWQAKSADYIAGIAAARKLRHALPLFQSGGARSALSPGDRNL